MSRGMSIERIDRMVAEQRGEPYSMQLQQVGRVPAIFVSEVEVGDHLMWNFGGTTTVKSIRPASAKFVEIVHVSDSGHDAGTEYTRRMKLDRLVAAGHPDGYRFKFRVINRGSTP